jgi:DNA polymerase elongation subunit (family B)
METEEIKEFLRSRQGYLKEGGKRLRDHLSKKGFNTTIRKCKQALSEIRAEVKNIKNKVNNNSARILIYDIETSYNIVKSWRVGYKLNLNPGDIIHERAIICVSWKWFGEDKVYNLTWDKNQDDKFLLEQFIEVLNEADMIVAHNGDNYDLKFIKTRAIYHRLSMRINYNQFDTLKVAKAKFMFNSNKLDYISKFLGANGKISTEMKLWDDIILHKNSEALNKMLTYCDEDVRQLEYVYNILSSWDNPRYHLGVIQGKTKQTSPITGNVNIEKVTSVTTNKGTIKHIMLDKDTNREFEMSNTNYLKYMLINK